MYIIIDKYPPGDLQKTTYVCTFFSKYFFSDFIFIAKHFQEHFLSFFVNSLCISTNLCLTFVCDYLLFPIQFFFFPPFYPYRHFPA